MKMQERRLVYFNPRTVKFQGMDQASGGYPFDANEFEQIKFWRLEDRERFIQYGTGGPDQLVPFEVTISFDLNPVVTTSS